MLKLFGSDTTAWCPKPLNFKAIFNNSNLITPCAAARPLYFLGLGKSLQVFTFTVFAAHGPVRTKRIFVLSGLFSFYSLWNRLSGASLLVCAFI